MDIHSLIREMEGCRDRGEHFDWRKLREFIHVEHENAANSEDRSALTLIYIAVMNLIEEVAIKPDDMAKFKEMRGQDYALFLVRETITPDGTLSPELLMTVTQREIDAGRMQPEHDLRLIARIGQFSRPTPGKWHSRAL